MSTAPTLNECQASIISFMDHNGIPMTKQRRILIEILGLFTDGFTLPQLFEKADEHKISDKTIFNFIKLMRKAQVVNPPTPAYYSFKVIDPEIVK